MVAGEADGSLDEDGPWDGGVPAEPGKDGLGDGICGEGSLFDLQEEISGWSDKIATLADIDFSELSIKGRDGIVVYLRGGA